MGFVDAGWVGFGFGVYGLVVGFGFAAIQILPFAVGFGLSVVCVSLFVGW